MGHPTPPPAGHAMVVTAPDGRRVTCFDGEHAAAVHVLASPLVWRKFARFVDPRDGEVDWTRLERHAGLHASSERLLARAAEDLYGAQTEQPPTLRRLCEVLETAHLVRVLEAVGLLRPDAAPPGGWDR